MGVTNAEALPTRARATQTVFMVEVVRCGNRDRVGCCSTRYSSRIALLRCLKHNHAPLANISGSCITKHHFMIRPSQTYRFHALHNLGKKHETHTKHTQNKPKQQRHNSEKLKEVPRGGSDRKRDGLGIDTRTYLLPRAYPRRECNVSTPYVLLTAVCRVT